MRAQVVIAGLVLGAVGCKEQAPPSAPSASPSAGADARAPEGAPSSPVSAASAPASALVPVGPGARPPAPKVDAALWEKLFPGPHPALPAPLAGVTLNDEQAAVRAAVAGLVPQVIAGGSISHDLLTVDEVRLGLYWHADLPRLRYVGVDLPADADQALAVRWGEPTQIAMGARRKGKVWVAPDRTLQAILEPQQERARLALWPLLAIDRLLDPGQRVRLGVEDPAHPLLGATVEVVETHYARLRPRRFGDERLDLYLPPHELVDRPTLLRLFLEGGKVARMELKLTYRPHASLRETIRKALAAKYGPPTEGVYGAKPRVEVDDAPGTGRITVRILP
jgi:hypothetical protein